MNNHIFKGLQGLGVLKSFSLFPLRYLRVLHFLTCIDLKFCNHYKKADPFEDNVASNLLPCYLEDRGFYISTSHLEEKGLYISDHVVCVVFKGECKFTFQLFFYTCQ